MTRSILCSYDTDQDKHGANHGEKLFVVRQLAPFIDLARQFGSIRFQMCRSGFQKPVCSDADRDVGGIRGRAKCSAATLRETWNHEGKAATQVEFEEVLKEQYLICGGALTIKK